MTVQVSSAAIDELQTTFAEIERLTAQTSMSKRDQSRFSWLLSKVSLLKAGISPSELRHVEHDRLLKELGAPRLPDPPRTTLGEEIEMEWRKFARGEPVRPTFTPSAEVRAYSGEIAGAQSITAPLGESGGFFTVPQMAARLWQNFRAFDDIFSPQFSYHYPTETGATTALPVVGDTGNEGVFVNESSRSTEVDITPLGSRQLFSWTARSNILPFSFELLNDTNFSVGEICERVFSRRLAAIVGQKLILGQGPSASEPTGLLTDAIAQGGNIVVADGSSSNTGGSETGATSIGSNDCARLYQALDPAYRNSRAAWYMADTTLLALMEILDKYGRPLIPFSDWSGSVDTPAAPRLFAKPIAICRSMPSVSGSSNPIIFSNADYFVIRDVPTFTHVRRYMEAEGLAENGLVALEMWMRVDSGLASGDTGSVPAAVLQCHS